MYLRIIHFGRPLRLSVWALCACWALQLTATDLKSSQKATSPESVVAKLGTVSSVSEFRDARQLVAALPVKEDRTVILNAKFLALIAGQIEGTLGPLDVIKSAEDLRRLRDSVKLLPLPVPKSVTFRTARMAPESIPDPEERAAYIAVLRKNQIIREKEAKKREWQFLFDECVMPFYVVCRHNFRGTGQELDDVLAKATSSAELQSRMKKYFVRKFQELDRALGVDVDVATEDAE